MQSSAENQRTEWAFWPIEEEALTIFAWSHPEIGNPDKLSFWRLALEMDVWWKFAQSTRTGLWARRTAYEVCEKWMSICDRAPFEALPLEKQKWWLETRARCLVIYDATMLVSLAQYHEYLVYRKDDASIESQDVVPLHLVEERTAIKILERQGIVPLPATERLGLVERYNYVTISAPEEFLLHSLRIQPALGEQISDPWIPILSLPRTHISAESAYEVDFLPDVNGQLPLALPPADSSTASLASPSSSSMDLTLPNRSSSLDLTSNQNVSKVLQSQPKTQADIAELLANDDFQRVVARTKQFFQEIGVSPAVGHLIYRYACAESPLEFAEFCRLYGLS